MIVGDYDLGLFAPKNCFEFRIGIEGEAAATAARKRTKGDLRRLQLAISALREQVGVCDGIDEDFLFHMEVARASRNHYFVSALSALKQTIREGMLLARTTTGLRTAEKIAAIEVQHQAIYDAIASGDETASRAAMRQHLQRCKASTSHWDLAELSGA